MIGIINYGLGNVCAFKNIYDLLRIESTIVESAADLDRSDKLILPGVGAFDKAMELLEAAEFFSELCQGVTEGKKPVLGVCVGMQILARSSEEGTKQGLSWVPGEVKRLADEGGKLKLPHMGWNTVEQVGRENLFAGIEQNARFYFLHSFYFSLDDCGCDIGNARYGHRFCCALRAENIFGVQFHPEKSHSAGVSLLRNFALL